MPKSTHILLPGRLALSETRLAGLAHDIGATELSAICVHFVDLSKRLEPREAAALDSLLAYGEVPRQHDHLAHKLADAVRSGGSVQDQDVLTCYVTPRSGTISPWSSQATAIAHVCGLRNAVRRIERGVAYAVIFPKSPTQTPTHWREKLFDRMTQEINETAPNTLFFQEDPTPAKTIPVLGGNGDSHELLQRANQDLGLGLEASELDYLVNAFSQTLRRDPVDVEVFSYAQVNSEHCRHKQFNADWTIDGEPKPKTLFEMIRNTHQQHPEYVVSAYSDNAAVFEGASGSHWSPNFSTGEWTQSKEMVHYLGKVETHNHPTAVSPFPGAATGSGGEIRDEAAVGRGSKSKSGLAGYCVSDLMIPGHVQPWERDIGRPSHIASSLAIMLEAPIGSAAFNNEYGRPCTAGFFRTLLMDCPGEGGKIETRGYHKPIMIAGGLGSVRPQHALKEKSLVHPGTHLVVLGGPAMLIGLGGGAASSVQSGESSVDLDFASVQRGNAEVQRRAQEVINACVSLGKDNPILLIHDVGAGGLSNALPELVHDAGMGATFELREIDNADRGMSPLQIWCCEAQERYVLAVSELGLNAFVKIAKRERCGFSVVGKTTGDRDDGSKRLVLLDRESKEFPKPIDLPMSVLFGKPPKLTKSVDSRKLVFPSFNKDLSTYLPQLQMTELIPEAVNRVLGLPAVGSKSFLITIGDRTVGGLTVRDQMVGRWQVPVADSSVTATCLLQGIKTGEAMALGEKPSLALISPAASARMAVAESLMNIAASDIADRLYRVRLSANWMAASSHPGEAAALYEAVEAIGMELCPELGISIPVGKDSMSMKMKWKDQKGKENKEVIAPLSLVITAFSLVRNLGSTWTPALRRLEDVGETILLFVDLAQGMKSLGGSALCQCFGQTGNNVPDIRDVELFKDFFDAIEQLHDSGIVLAYHDRSDGGLFTTLVEMMFAGRCGIDVMLDHVALTKRTGDVIEALFNEELGAVFQVRKEDEIEFNRCFATCGPPPGLIKRIGRVPSTMKQNLSVYHGVDLVYSNTRADLQRKWASTSHQMQRLRDDAICADEEFETIEDNSDPGLSFRLTFDPKDNILPFSSTISSAFFSKPRVAILREQGVNGQAEMAFAFHSAGFSAIDVHMEDIISGRVSLASFVGMAACGGFSYGDVLGGGRGWAMSVLLHEKVREEFRTFFERPDTFTLGVCNGCQFLSRIREIIPGVASWPTFERNKSEQFEARVSMVKVSDPPGEKPSVFFHGMHGSALPIVTAHGEGRATFTETANASTLQDDLVPLRYVDNRMRPTERYPFNPNGSPAGIAGVRSKDGRCLALMPHPERTIIKEVASWIPKEQSKDWGDFGPWIRLFRSARRFVG